MIEPRNLAKIHTQWFVDIWKDYSPRKEKTNKYKSYQQLT